MEWSGLIASSAGIGALVSAIVGPVVSYFLERRKIERQKEEDRRQKEEDMKPCYLGVVEALDDFARKCRLEIDEIWEEYNSMFPQDDFDLPGSYERKNPPWKDKKIFYEDSFLIKLPADFQSKMKNLEREFLNSVHWVEKNINHDYHDTNDVFDLYSQSYAFYGKRAIEESIEIRSRVGLHPRVDGGEFSKLSDYVRRTLDDYNGKKGDPYHDCRILPELRG